MSEAIERIKKFYKFSQEETRNITLIIIAFTLMLGFDDGSDKFVVAKWVANLVLSFLIVLFGFFIHVSAQKIWGAVNGIRMEQQISWPGIVAGLVLALISRGAITVYLPGTFKAYHVASIRPGKFRHGLNISDVSYMAMAGPVANVFFAMMAKAIFFQLFGVDSLFLNNFIMFNFLLALFTMLPIPGQTGLYAFFGSRLWYVVGFGVLVGYVILYSMGVYSMFGALAIGFLVWLMYYFFFERKT